MKSSLRMLRGFASHTLNHKGGGGKERKRGGQHLRAAQLDEVLEASQDMQDMRSCYDSLLTAAATTAQSAFEFSEALREMGDCFLEKTALNDDEESGKILLMLGKTQFKLQKLVDTYRYHIIKTIRTPSESLLNELRIVEEMKRQCDEKREVYHHMLTSQTEKGMPKTTKGKTFSPEQLKYAQEEYDEEATLFIFRMKSLKQGQSRSLLTQAARHHAAQLSFFQKGLRALEKIEPHLKQVADQQHIDYYFNELEDDRSDDGDDLVDVDYDDSELSFDCGRDHPQEGVSTSRTSMEVDQADHSSIPAVTPEIPQDLVEKSQASCMSVGKVLRSGSHSEPLFPEKKFREMRQSSKKLHSYVLPTPVDGRSSSVASSHSVYVSKTGSASGWPVETRHSTSLEPNRSSTDFKTQLSGTPGLLRTQSVLKERNITSDITQLQTLLSDGLSFTLPNPNSGSDNKKLKRQVFSGPLSNAGSGKPVSSRNSVDCLQTAFSMPMCVAANQPSTSPQASPNASPLRISQQKTKLHELPRPPNTAKSLKPPSSNFHFTTPLGSRNPELSLTSRMPSISTHMPSPLPRPPITMARSYSIPTSSKRTVLVTVGSLLEAPASDADHDVASSAFTKFTSSPNQELPSSFSEQPGRKLKSEP